MKDTQDANRDTGDTVDDDIRSAIDDKFPGPFDSARTATLRKSDQSGGLYSDPLVDGDSCTRVVTFDVIEYQISISLGKDSPLQPQALTFSGLRSAADRRRAKCASTLL